MAGGVVIGAHIMDLPSLPHTRREFLHLAAGAALATVAGKALAAETPVKIPLGMDNFAVRQVWHKLAAHFSALLDLLFVDGPIRSLWVNRIVQFFR